MKKNILLLLSIATHICFAQNKNEIHKSIHQEEAEKYAQYNLSTDAQWDSLREVQTGIAQTSRFDQRANLYWLHAVYSSVSGRCHRWCGKTDAHDYWSAVYGL